MAKARTTFGDVFADAPDVKSRLKGAAPKAKKPKFAPLPKAKLGVKIPKPPKVRY